MDTKKIINAKRMLIAMNKAWFCHDFIIEMYFEPRTKTRFMLFYIRETFLALKEMRGFPKHNIYTFNLEH